MVVDLMVPSGPGHGHGEDNGGKGGMGMGDVHEDKEGEEEENEVEDEGVVRRGRSRGRGWGRSRGRKAGERNERPTPVRFAKTAGAELPPRRREGEGRYHSREEGHYPREGHRHHKEGKGSNAAATVGASGDSNANPSRPSLSGALDRGAEFFSQVVLRGRMKRLVGCWVPLRDGEGKVGWVVLVLVPGRS